MKTKYFFALALPVALASCSDQLETISNNQPVADGNRRMVKVNINVDGSEQTRLSYQNGTGYVFDGEDEAFGACLMDVLSNPWAYPNTGSTWQDNFSLVNYIQTNYKFAKSSEGTSFSSEATLCEGNYFFYYPYNANNLLREALVLQAPNQIVMDGTKSALDVLKDQKFVGYATVKAEPGKEVASLTVEPKPIFSLAGVRIVNTGTQPKTISKITLERPGKFVKEVVIDPTHDYGWPRFDVNNPNALDAVYVPSGVERYDQAVVTYSPSKILSGSLNGTESTLAYFLALSDEIDNPNPYGPCAYTCRVYCEEGLGIADLSADHVDAGSGATNIPNEGNFGAGISYNHLTVAKVTIDDTALGHPDQLDIYSEDELRLLVNWSKDWTSARTLTADLKNDIKLTQKVVDLLANNKLLTLNVTSSASKTFIVPAGLNNLDKANRINVGCYAEIAKGATVSTNDFNFAGGVKVNGTFNVNGNMSNYAENFGVVNVKSNASVDVYNYAEMNVDAKTSGSIYQYGDASILNVNNTVNAYVGNYASKAKVVVAANGVLNSTYNAGTIENTGEISNITNYGLVTIKAATAKYKSNDGANGYVDITVKPNFYNPGDGEKNQATTTIANIPGYTGTYELAKVVLTDASVSADKSVTVAEIELPNLATVGGKLTLTGEVKLGAKNITVSKDLTINGNATLATKNAYVLVKSGKTFKVTGDLSGTAATVEAETDGVITIVGNTSGVTVKTW